MKSRDRDETETGRDLEVAPGRDFERLVLGLFDPVKSIFLPESPVSTPVTPTPELMILRPGQHCFQLTPSDFVIASLEHVHQFRDFLPISFSLSSLSGPITP